MRGRCDNPKCGRQFGLQAVETHWNRKFCSKPCKTQYRHDQREERRRKRVVRAMFRATPAQ